jgi:hypothetical protein
MKCKFCQKELEPHYYNYCGEPECNRQRRNKASLDCIKRRHHNEKTDTKTKTT